MNGWSTGLFGYKNPATRPEIREKIRLGKIGEKNPNWKPKICRECPICQKVFFATELSHVKTCSKECGYKLVAQHMKANNPMKNKEISNKVFKINEVRGMFVNGGNLGHLWNNDRDKMLKSVRNYMINCNPMFNSETKIKALSHPNRKARPNKFETKFMDFLRENSLPFKYVGDNQFFITCKCGRVRNPDFIHTEKGVKILIEVGSDNSHPLEDVQGMIEQYATMGWKCLYYYDHEFYADKKRIKIDIEKELLYAVC